MFALFLDDVGRDMPASIITRSQTPYPRSQVQDVSIALLEVSMI